MLFYGAQVSPYNHDGLLGTGSPVILGSEVIVCFNTFKEGDRPFKLPEERKGNLNYIIYSEGLVPAFKIKWQ